MELSEWDTASTARQVIFFFFYSAALDGRDHFQRGVFNAYQDRGSSMCEINGRLASVRGIRQEYGKKGKRM